MTDNKPGSKPNIANPTEVGQAKPPFSPEMGEAPSPSVSEVTGAGAAVRGAVAGLTKDLTEESWGDSEPYEAEPYEAERSKEEATFELAKRVMREKVENMAKEAASTFGFKPGGELIEVEINSGIRTLIEITSRNNIYRSGLLPQDTGILWGLTEQSSGQYHRLKEGIKFGTGHGLKDINHPLSMDEISAIFKKNGINLMTSVMDKPMNGTRD